MKENNWYKIDQPKQTKARGKKPCLNSRSFKTDKSKWKTNIVLKVDQQNQTNAIENNILS